MKNKKYVVRKTEVVASYIVIDGAKNYKDYSLKILKICKKKPISFEVFADDQEEMLKQAYKDRKSTRLNYSHSQQKRIPTSA